MDVWFQNHVGSGYGMVLQTQMSEVDMGWFYGFKCRKWIWDGSTDSNVGSGYGMDGFKYLDDFMAVKCQKHRTNRLCIKSIPKKSEI